MSFVPEIFLGCPPPQKKFWTGIIKFGLVLTIVQNFALVGPCISEISWGKKKNVMRKTEVLPKTIVFGRTKKLTWPAVSSCSTDSSLPTDVTTLQTQCCWDYIAADNDSELYSFNLILLTLDTIDISTLLCHLRYFFDISGPALNWISSYVVGRTQFVCVGQEQLPRTDCEYGVPQGSNLGPLLFTLYISHVASIISSFGIDHAQYADDTQLYVALKDGSLSALKVHGHGQTHSRNFCRFKLDI